MSFKELFKKVDNKINLAVEESIKKHEGGDLVCIDCKKISPEVTRLPHPYDESMKLIEEFDKLRSMGNVYDSCYYCFDCISKRMNKGEK